MNTHMRSVFFDSYGTPYVSVTGNYEGGQVFAFGPLAMSADVDVDSGLPNELEWPLSMLVRENGYTFVNEDVQFICVGDATLENGLNAVFVPPHLTASEIELFIHSWLDVHDDAIIIGRGPAMEIACLVMGIMVKNRDVESCHIMTQDTNGYFVRIRFDEDGRFIDRWPNGFYQERMKLLNGEPLVRS